MYTRVCTLQHESWGQGRCGGSWVGQEAGRRGVVIPPAEMRGRWAKEAAALWVERLVSQFEKN